MPAIVAVRVDGQTTTGDSDGDGIANGQDNCPSYFNPPRPLDGDAQADGDLDGLGDICDPCPNGGSPGPDGCAVSVYDIKGGVVPPGTPVNLNEMIVTAAEGNAFYATLDQGSAAYEGSAYSSIYVYHPGVTQPGIGAEVNVSGVVGDYFGQIQLEAEDVEIVRATGPAPIPSVVSPSAVATGGSDALAYEAHLVTVEDVTVIDADPTGQPGENVSGEFVVTKHPGTGGRVDRFPLALVAGDAGSNRMPRRFGTDALRQVCVGAGLWKRSAWVHLCGDRRSRAQQSGSRPVAQRPVAARPVGNRASAGDEREETGGAGRGLIYRLRRKSASEESERRSREDGSGTTSRLTSLQTNSMSVPKLAASPSGMENSSSLFTEESPVMLRSVKEPTKGKGRLSAAGISMGNSMPSMLSRRPQMMPRNPSSHSMGPAVMSKRPGAVSR